MSEVDRRSDAGMKDLYADEVKVYRQEVSRNSWQYDQYFEGGTVTGLDCTRAMADPGILAESVRDYESGIVQSRWEREEEKAFHSITAEQWDAWEQRQGGYDDISYSGERQDIESDSPC